MARFLRVFIKIRGKIHSQNESLNLVSPEIFLVNNGHFVSHIFIYLGIYNVNFEGLKYYFLKNVNKDN